MTRSMESVVILAMAFGCASAHGDVVHLKDKASVSGKILAEKSDYVVVDLGFTALTIPK